MLRLFFVFALGIAFNIQVAHGAANALSGIATKRMGQDFFVELNFTEDISENGVTLDYANRTIEVNIPSAVAQVKKGITKVNDETIDHVYTTQNAPEEAVKCRIILTPPNQAAEFRNTTAVLSRANKLFVKIGNPHASTATALVSAATTELPGALIDQLMRQEAGETTATPIPLALPEKKAEEKEKPQEKIMKAGAEDNLPVFKSDVQATKDKKDSGKDLWKRMLMSLLVVLSVFGGGVYAFKRWPGAKKITSRSRLIEVVAQHHLGAKRSVAVIKVAGEAVLIGITDNNISILKTLSLLDEDLPSHGNKPPAKFNSALAREVQGEVARKATLDEVNSPDRDEEFSMRGLREIVGERLKSMREL